MLKRTGSQAPTPAPAPGPAPATKGGGAVSQAPPPGAPSYQELQANLSKVIEENIALRKERDDEKKAATDLKGQLEQSRAREQQLSRKIEDLQQEAGGSKGNWRGSAAVGGLSLDASGSGSAGGSLARQLTQRLMDEHRSREELEERYAVLAEKYGRMKEQFDWGEVATADHGQAGGADRRRLVGAGNEVAKVVVQTYQRKIKDSYLLSRKLETLSSKLEALTFSSAAEQVSKHAERLQQAAAESG